MIIRGANPSDALNIAKIQVEGWKTAYKAIFTEAYLFRIS